jgi:high-affinity iron transporter
MLPALLISLREVIEATLIVATVVGILTKLKQNQLIKTVSIATFWAVFASVGFLALASFLGVRIQEYYTGELEEVIEGSLMLISAGFVTWAVFFLHNTFAHNKIKLIEKINNTVNSGERRAIFILVFTAVFREGFEIVLFLSTLYLSTNPQQIFTGFVLGTAIGLVFCYLLFKTTVKLPIHYAFKATSFLLVLFAAGLFARGLHEFTEIGVIPEFAAVTFSLLPEKTTILGAFIKTIFGITKKMDYLQLSVYLGYLAFMAWWLQVEESSVEKN